MFIFSRLLFALNFFLITALLPSQFNVTMSASQYGEENNLESKASEDHILKITTDQNNNDIFNMYLEIDELQKIVKIHNKSHGGTDTFNADQLRQKIVIHRAQGKNILVISSQDFDAYNGGRLKLKFLRNVINNLHGEFYMRLEHNGDKWMLYSDSGGGKGEVIHNIFLKTNRIFGRVIGIDKIIPNHTIIGQKDN